MASRNYYQLAVRHAGLGKYRIIRGSDRYVVEATARSQEQTWHEQYAKKLAGEEKRRDRENQKQELEDKLGEAENRTQEAHTELETLRRLLAYSLRNKQRVEWESLKRNQPFSQSQPAPRPYQPFPTEPKPEDAAYQPRITIMGRIIHSVAEKSAQEAEIHFAAQHEAWKQRVAVIETTNQCIYEENLREYEDWRQRAEAYETARASHNEIVEGRRAAYQALNEDAVLEFCELVLSQSKYPDCCPKEFELDYQKASKTLVADYHLPTPDELPKLLEVKFVRTRGEFTETELSKKQFEELYEDVTCQIALRTVHELFEEDSIRALDAVVFNGNVKAVDPGTGNIAARCIMSVMATRAQFLALNLLNVQPRACFETLGGIASKKSIDLKKIKPHISIDFDDARFATAENLNETPSSALDEWRELVKSLDDQSSARFLKVGSLAAIVGFPVADKYSAALSRELAAAIAARGFAVEPDTRFGANPYRAMDEIAIFRPIHSKITKTYTGAAILLQLCVMVAAANDHIGDAELKVAHDFITGNSSLDAGDLQRLNVFEMLLRRNPDMSRRSLARIVKHLPADKRELIAEVLIYVAAADGKITSGEWIALDRARLALELPQGTIESILRKLGAQFDEPTVQKAEPGLPGEPILNTSKQSAPAISHEFSIDMTKVAKISQETKAVIGILSDVMNEDEGNSKQSSTDEATQPFVQSAINPKIDAKAAPADSSSKPWLTGLDTMYQPIVTRLIEKSSWTRGDFNQLASEFKLMPLGVFDALNEWSDEHLGDFLLDGDDPIEINRRLIPKEALT